MTPKTTLTPTGFFSLSVLNCSCLFDIQKSVAAVRLGKEADKAKRQKRTVVAISKLVSPTEFEEWKGEPAEYAYKESNQERLVFVELSRLRPVER